ncbi:Nramp family divalent metal transporter [Planctomicrobium piriforme]|uniref:Mn2+ and Fe2+ transporters of the NRAMP family n=1 Tax=Planctomicrobium piriforme TaxID=1576369 RepID=A0A1I3AQI0_9PLAN|nr:Nramp family divalent metal transporter [Planctomicrobium piriforme]SFH52305.1 Mn2+ and Fe2+ transporters of the NRAMP family [Planctomicrobium piriforme]
MVEEIAAYDPYALPPEDVQEPPTSLWAALRKIGPGIILAGTIVGSGELILTTGLGAKHGYVFLWLILFSCVIKVFVQIELGRYAISSGRPTLGALNELPGKGRGVHWLVWWWFLMMICTVMQLGGMTGGVGQVLHLAFPGLTERSAAAVAGMGPLAERAITARPEFLWALATCLTTMALIYHGGYRRIEWLTTVIVVSVTLITVTAVIALTGTEFPIRATDLLSGLQFKVPSSGQMAAFAVFGITGVGATELFYYPYWCLEKGYARYVGRNDGSEAWERRAKGWIRVMQLDAWVSMIVFTVSTVSFYLLGAAVLNPQGLDPKGTALIDTLSKMYIGPFGAWTRVLFLIGAGAVLFKTLYLACAANSRLAADFLILAGFTPSANAEERLKLIRRLCLFFPALAFTFYLFLHDPQLLVKIGGIAQAATLPMIALATLYFRYKKVDKRLTPNWITDILLWIAVISILFVASYMVPSQAAEAIKMLNGLF